VGTVSTSKALIVPWRLLLADVTKKGNLDIWPWTGKGLVQEKQGHLTSGGGARRIHFQKRRGPTHDRATHTKKTLAVTGAARRLTNTGGKKRGEGVVRTVRESEEMSPTGNDRSLKEGSR